MYYVASRKLCEHLVCVCVFNSAGVHCTATGVGELA